MKTWQKGYDLEDLKEAAEPFQRLKPYCHGAFGLPKERDVATALSLDRMAFANYENEGRAVALFRLAQHRSHLTVFHKRKLRIFAGDLLVSAFAGPTASKVILLRGLLKKAGERPAIVQIFEEIREDRAILRNARFEKIATSVSASSDLKGIYCRGLNPSERLSDPMPQVDDPGLECLDPAFAGADILGEIKDELQAYGDRWAQHYSSYNKRRSWTAFALRGFDPEEPSFIVKPREMSKKWKLDNPGRLRDPCERTSAAQHFPSAMALAARIPGRKERVRFMRLRSKNGELSRHADITDLDAGTLDGRLCRLHIPISTQEGCKFSSWDLEGQRKEEHLPAGSLWYLDIRKPHAVVNKGEVDRVHLVIDCESNEEIRRMIGG